MKPIRAGYKIITFGFFSLVKNDISWSNSLNNFFMILGAGSLSPCLKQRLKLHAEPVSGIDNWSENAVVFGPELVGHWPVVYLKAQIVAN